VNEVNFREATINDIPQIQFVRNLVKENTLSNPSLVTDADCEEFLMRRGKGWVCELNEKIVGFAIADLKEENIWALFILPEYEGKGIGKHLHKLMLDWYFSQGQKWVWLGTSPNTRAELFYRRAGWRETGKRSNGETRFELTSEEWKSISNT
jgi:GNAT superfamily N-acetyltransferase